MSAAHPSKRNKKTTSRHNALFEHWLTKAMEEAFAKELKSYHTYKKALSSLRKYPLVLGSGKECRILEGFGPKLCDFLDAKLASYAAELGMSLHDALIYGNKEKTKLPSTVAKAAVVQPNLSNSTSSNSESSVQQPLTGSVFVLRTLSTDASSCTLTTSPVMENSTVLTTTEQQLMDLFRSSKNPMGCSLHEIASCLRSPGKNHNLPPIMIHLDHLLSLGLISPVENRPGRYILNTQSSTGSEGNSTGPKSPCSSALVQPTNSSTNSLETRSTVLPALIDYPLKFRYANEAGEPVQFRIDAYRKTFDPDDGEVEEKPVGFRILCSYEELLLVGVPYRLDWNAPSVESTDEQLTFAFLLDPDAPPQSTLVVALSEGSDPLLTEMVSSCSVPTSPVNGTSITVGKRPGSPIATSVPAKVVLKRSVSASCAVLTSSVTLLAPQSTMSSNPNARSQPTSPTRTQSGILSRLITHEASPNIVVPGGSYKLVLLTDVREQFGLNRVKQLLPPVLCSLGVECESRALPVGDFLWIARWFNESGRPMEAVLDYVIERKRIDDLASSMVDGRFQEQKYRMKRTQLAHPIFLIEECASMRNQRIPFETLLQAISNAQIIDGFQVMTTRCPEDTVDLLAAMTNVLWSDCGHDLHVQSIIDDTDSISRTTELNPDYQRAVSWATFIQLANKSPPPTVRDVFARQLLQVHGFSGPKISAILDQYPTPACLMRAYNSQATKSAKENMLSSLKIGDTNRCIGGVLSKRVYLAYNTL